MKEIADSMEIPAHYMSKVMRTMVKSGLVRSDMGPGGGYYLAREPADITLREVYEAVEGNFQVISCVDGAGDCVHYGDCSHVDVWNVVEGRILELLDDLHLSSFLVGPAKDVFVSVDSVHTN